jgi:chromosome segregation ATPase
MAEPSLELLQAMVQRVLDKLSDHDSRFTTIDQRLTALEKHMAGLRYVGATDAQSVANVQEQMARLDVRLQRIERRLDLVDTP